MAIVHRFTIWNIDEEAGSRTIYEILEIAHAQTYTKRGYFTKPVKEIVFGAIEDTGRLLQHEIIVRED